MSRKAALGFGYGPSVAYDQTFFDEQRGGSRRSAETIVPLALGLAPIRSVVDVGCGVGTWAGVFARFGVEVLGVDGDYVDRSALEIPADSFVAHDLTDPLDLGRRFDLAVCLEVGEHLPPESAETLVASLVAASDRVLFSAAIPGQGGTDHVNEQWPSYWADLFAEHNYRAFDAIRPMVWWDDEVEVFYRQNILVFARGNALIEPQTGLLDAVHPEHLEYVTRYYRDKPLGLREVPGAIREAVQARRQRG